MKKLILLFALGTTVMYSKAQCTANFTIDASSDPLITLTNTSTGTYSGYGWDFGDGTFASTLNASHTYTYNGAYSICLTVYDSTAGCYNTFCDSIFITNGTPAPSCVANFSFINYNLLINFTNTSTPGSYYWDLGDGSSSFSTNPNHLYAVDGTYHVCLTVTDSSAGCSDSYCIDITVADSAGTPGCTAWYVYSSTNLDVNFTNTSSSGSYYWDFGDGTTSFATNPSHTYASPGTYNVCLTVVDSSSSCYDTYCHAVTVYSPCNATFTTYLDSSGSTVVSFVSAYSYSYLWDFGDGTTSTSATPSHTYTVPGTYLVCLTVTDSSAGCTSTFCDSVYVPSGFLHMLSLVSGISEVKNPEITTVFPNPTQNQLTIKLSDNLENAYITITNLIGEIVFTVQSDIAGNRYFLNVSDLTNGIYFITITAPNGTFAATRKFVKN